MKRILKAVTVVLFLALLMGVTAWALVDLIGWQIPEWVVMTLGYLFAWPLLVLDPFIPASDSSAPYAPLVRSLMYILAVILDTAVYSFLIYLVLYWREKRGISSQSTHTAA
jgi:hypothetical protein